MVPTREQAVTVGDLEWARVSFLLSHSGQQQPTGILGSITRDQGGLWLIPSKGFQETPI